MVYIVGVGLPRLSQKNGHSSDEVGSSKSRLVSPFWYWLTQEVPDRGPLSGCCCCCIDSYKWCLLTSTVIRFQYFRTTHTENRAHITRI